MTFKTSDYHVFQETEMKILILNMDQEQQLIAGVESFSKENSFILAVTVWQIGDRLVQESLFMLLVNL